MKNIAVSRFITGTHLAVIDSQGNETVLPIMCLGARNTDYSRSYVTSG